MPKSTQKNPKAKPAKRKVKAAVRTHKPAASTQKAIVDQPTPSVMVPESKERKDYVVGIGRRKTSIARVRFYKKGNGEITVNGKDYARYFSHFELQQIVAEPLQATSNAAIGSYTVKVSGGGIRGQAESIRLGISRILVGLDESQRKLLRANNFLTRDPRAKERKKYGLRKARRAPQWQKR